MKRRAKSMEQKIGDGVQVSEVREQVPAE